MPCGKHRSQNGHRFACLNRGMTDAATRHLIVQYIIPVPAPYLWASAKAVDHGPSVPDFNSAAVRDPGLTIVRHVFFRAQCLTIGSRLEVARLGCSLRSWRRQFRSVTMAAKHTERLCSNMSRGVNVSFDKCSTATCKRGEEHSDPFELRWKHDSALIVDGNVEI